MNNFLSKWLSAEVNEEVDMTWIPETAAKRNQAAQALLRALAESEKHLKDEQREVARELRRRVIKMVELIDEVEDEKAETPLYITGNRA